MYVVFLGLLLALTVDGTQRVNVVLMGATGNLAEKYLWQGLFNIHSVGLADDLQDDDTQLFVYPAATKSVKDNSPILDRIIQNNITWGNVPGAAASFLARTWEYVQLREPEHYQSLASTIEKNQREDGEQEAGRLVYLSVPPKFFGSISALINQHLRPKNPNAWLRVIVEKPFGVDTESAKQLSNDMYQSLSNDEILLVDHYMGKVGMHSIRHFVHAHSDLFESRKVRKIEAAMLETDDCKGRTGFYDEVGVVRDTLQNHVTQMVALLGMNAKQSQLDEPTARKELLESLSHATLDRVVKIAQYSSYNSHVNEDRRRWNEDELETPSQTLTYAHVVLKVSEKDHPLDNVPIHLVSGKALAARQSYVEVEFENDDVLLFNFQGKKGHVKDAAVYMKSRKTTLTSLPGWSESKTSEGTLFSAPESPFAYELLLRAGLEGQKQHFVRLDEVLQSWEIWTPLLKQLEQYPSVESYKPGSHVYLVPARDLHDEL